MPCPHCAATVTAAQPRRTALGYRTFRCGACRRICHERTGTLFNRWETEDCGTGNADLARPERLRVVSAPLRTTEIIPIHITIRRVRESPEPGDRGRATRTPD